MVTTMTVAEKRALRDQKLKDLYELNEKNAGREVNIKYTDLNENEDNKKEHLAFEYLLEKGLIAYKIRGRNLYTAKITAYGIDYVESNLI